MSGLLRDQWRRALRSVLTDLATGARTHESLARLSAQVELDYHGRFLVELVQNAVDQANAAGMGSSACRVWRRPGVVAVANQGRPFDAKGVEAITGIALSDKRADTSIGNKGIGFKAVFEVTDAAEVYSAAPGGDLTHAPALRMRLQQTVGEPSPALREFAAQMLAERPEDASDIQVRNGGEPLEVVVEALHQLAGWEFPVELTHEDWQSRLDSLGVTADALARFSTLIVLPLRPGAEESVNAAIQHIGDPEVLLFLDGVSTLCIDDSEIRTITRLPDQVLGPASAVVQRVLRSPEGERRWWVAQARCDGPDLRAAAAALPGPGWQGLGPVDVRVALPIPVDDAPLLTNGRYYIGLPTNEQTGTPFRVDARFFGTLARKSLDLSIPFNRLLFGHAVPVATGLLRWLRSAGVPDLAGVEVRPARRAVAWALAHDAGSEFGEALRAAMAGESILLRRGDDHVVPAAQVTVPAKADDPLVKVLVASLERGALRRTYGLALPDAVLVAKSRTLLHELGGGQDFVGRVLGRPAGHSALEDAARRMPRDAGSFSTVLRWVTERGGASAADQQVLPLVGDRWATPASKPYIPLPREPRPSEVGAEELPPDLLARLPVLDGAVLPADSELEVLLLRGKLVLARAPLRAEVLADTILPALHAAIDAGEDDVARELLVLGLRWAAKAGDGPWRATVRWRVPTTAGTWVEAGRAYFGDAWRDADAVKPPPIEQVFGPQGRCVAVWWGAAEEKTQVKTWMQAVGVRSEPAVYPLPDHEVLRQSWLDAPPTDPTVPAAMWPAYLTYLAGLAASDRAWRLQSASWIDGFESGDGRSALAGWALRFAPTAFGWLTAERRTKKDRPPHHQVMSPWLFALTSHDQPFLPTDQRCAGKGRLARWTEVVRISEAVDDVIGWIAVADRTIDDKVLEALGVVRLADALVAWLVDRLVAVAGGVAERPTEAERAAQVLWSAVSGRLRQGQDALPEGVAELCLPLWVDGEITSVRVGDLRKLVVLDDPYQAEVFATLWAGVAFLEPDGKDWRPLHQALPRALPGVEVVLASEVGIPVTVPPGAQREKIVDVIARCRPKLTNLLYGVLTLLPSDVPEARRKDALKRLEAAEVVRLDLDAALPAAVWLADRNLLVMRPSSRSNDVVAELWPIVGKEWRDPLRRLADAAEKGIGGLAVFRREKALRGARVRDACAKFGYTWDDSSEEELEKGPAPAGSSWPSTAAGSPVDSGPTAFPPDRASTAPPRSPPGVAPDPPDQPLVYPPPAFTSPVRLDRPAPPAGVATGLRRAQEDPSAPVGGGSTRTGGSAGAPSRPAWHPPAPDDGRYREVGHQGEVFAFRQFKEWYPGFDEHCWVSSSRQQLGITGGDDTLGYDFVYDDLQGDLGGVPGARCLIEVKANGGPLSSRFMFTRHEWEVALEANARGDVYLIARVSHVDSQPRVAAVLPDPVAMIHREELELQVQSYWITDRRSHG